MNLSKKLVAVAAAGLSLTGVLAVSAGPAQAAGAPYQWVFADGHHSAGKATYIAKGNKILLCDTKRRDGYIVYVAFDYEKKNGARIYKKLKNPGDKNDCVGISIPNAKKNRKLYLLFWIYSSKNTYYGGKTYTT